MPSIVTSFKQPPWASYEVPSSPESSPTSSPVGTPLRARRDTPRTPRVPEPVSAQAKADASFSPEMLGGVPFSSDVLDLSPQGGANACRTQTWDRSLAKLQHALGLGDGRLAGIWVRLPNGVRTPMILRRHGDAGIELALLYEKRPADGAGPVDRADLSKRLKDALTAGSKTAFKCYGHIAEVWKTPDETAGACHRRIADQLHWQACAGKTLHAGLEEERELRKMVGEPAWNALQRRRTEEHALGFVLPRQAASGTSPRERDDMTKVIAAKLGPIAAEASRNTRVKSPPAHGDAAASPPAASASASASRPRGWAAFANRTVLLDIMPPIGE